MKSKCEYKKTKRRVGRGPGSTKGKTCGRGTKGQYSRSGAKARLHAEGGQNTFIRRLPKRGFNQANKIVYEIVNVSALEQIGKSEINPDILIELGLFKKISVGVKVLGKGDITKAVTVHAHQFSQAAIEKIEKAGGKAIKIQAS